MRNFYETSIKYVLETFSFDDKIITSASWVDIKDRAHAKNDSVLYFVDRFDHFFNFTDQELNALSEEFVDYTCLSDKAIPDHIWKDAEVITKNKDDSQNVYYRDDILWAFLSELKLPDSGSPHFKFLSKVARLVLVLPHSDASSERIFSLTRKNKTVFHLSLSTERTLVSVLTVRVNQKDPCHKFKPPASLLKKAKRCTWKYNQLHSKNSKRKIRNQIQRLPKNILPVQIPQFNVMLKRVIQIEKQKK